MRPDDPVIEVLGLLLGRIRVLCSVEKKKVILVSHKKEDYSSELFLFNFIFN